MSWVTLAPPQERPGHLVCACDLTPPASREFAKGAPGVAAPAGVFALTVLAQALTAAVLPVAGVILAPKPVWAALPYALTLVGAGVATLPAAALTDLFGRRAALALGASLGLAGGAVAAQSFVAGQFFGLALGAFWLGVAQGFGFFYRHAPALRAGDKPRAVAFVLGAGALAGLLAPAAIGAAQRFAGPHAPAAALLCAGVAQVAILALALSMRAELDIAAAASTRTTRKGLFVVATIAAAAAWFAMTSLMAHAAPAMALCGVGAAAASGVIASHILSMYAPAALVGAWVGRFGAVRVAAGGLALILGALVAARLPATAFNFAALMAVGGCGWSLAMLGATTAIHSHCSPSPRVLALHDSALFAAAIAGAFIGTFGR
ncbi:MAG: hypothetical protein ACLQJL_03655 [Roseiarcus sp.]